MTTTNFTWDEARRELQQRRERAKQMGGEEAVARQRAGGRGTVRERIDYLVDEGSFLEMGTLAVIDERNPDGTIREKRPAGHVMGLAKVDGRPVAVGADDFTIHGGAMTIYLDRVKGGMGGFVEDMAYEYKIPLFIFIEGIGGDVAINDRKGHAPLVSSMSFERPFSLLAEVPVLGAIMGAAAGAAAARAIISHFSVMPPTGFSVTAGPPVVERALGRKIDKFELGGVQVHTKNGTIDNPAKDEHDAIDQMKRVLTYLPQNAWELPPFVPNDDPPDRMVAELYRIMPENLKRPFKARALVEAIVDQGTFFEIGPDWGKAVVTGFARMGGYVVGVICSNPFHLGGALDTPTSEKQARFMDFCDIFNIPMVYLYFVDEPGVMIGPEAERTSAIRKGIRALQVTYQVDVPILAVYVRKAYGMGANTTSNPERLGLRFAWPGTEFGDLPIEGSVAAGYRRAIAAAPDPEAFRKEIEDRMREEASTWKTAEAFGLEEMIDPAETRMYLCKFIAACQRAMATRVGRKARYGLRL
jgi:acetyl-CoA carboxylase carboxyltransferase component